MDIADYSKYTQFYTEEIPPMLLGLLRENQWESYADLGCGDGALLDALNKLDVFAGKSVYAVELSRPRLDLVEQINSNFTCLLSDACDTSIKDGGVDFLVSSQVIEHVENDSDVIKEIQRILSPGGMVYLSTIFKKWYGWYFYRCNGKWTIDPTHLREYDRDDQLLPLLERHGLEVLVSKKTLESRPIMDALLRRLGAARSVYTTNPLLKKFRSIRAPIPGYYIWDIVCKKK